MKSKVYKGNEKRSSTIDFIKGISIIFVVICHFNFSDSEYKRIFGAFWLDMAVPVFMMVTGYTSSLSFKKHKIDSIEKAYRLNIIIRKILKYTLPWFAAFLFELFYYWGIDGIRGFGIKFHIYRFFNGGVVQEAIIILSLSNLYLLSP